MGGSERARAQAVQAGADKLSPDLRERLAGGKGDARVTTIVQLKSKQGLQVDALLQNLGVRLQLQLRNLNANVVSLPLSAVEALAARSEVQYISLDRKVATSGHLTNTTGTDAIRVQTSTLLLGITTTSTLDGSGIGIAILDSGIDAGHSSFTSSSGLSRITVSRDFTGESRTDDPYGHGTHVASIAAGNGQPSNGAYTGVAPNAKLINLRVLNSHGTGTSSGVLSALDWVLANRTLYNIRVVNMSLGAPAVDSYKNDPVCRAVRRLVDAGLVVLAAAGNNGKDGFGNKIYGQIHSPGNEPSAITVGAANSYGTDGRADDGVATYSSRGPTRSYTIDESGVRHYDNLMKPDLTAPGNRLIGAAANGNYLLTTYPELDAAVSSYNSRRMMYLSGTSMATPVAAGAAALLL
ncbi:MAG TPA: S8 family serine peptidase, partial [Pyrinomonadaceae bacterium]